MKLLIFLEFLNKKLQRKVFEAWVYELQVLKKIIYLT